MRGSWVAGHDAWQSAYRIVPYANKPGAPAITRASYVVEAGRAAAKQV